MVPLGWKNHPRITWTQRVPLSANHTRVLGTDGPNIDGRKKGPDIKKLIMPSKQKNKASSRTESEKQENVNINIDMYKFNKKRREKQTNKIK